MTKAEFSEFVNEILAASPRSTIDIPPRSLRDSLIATANAWRDFYRQAKSANYRSDHIDMAIRVSIQQSDPDDDNAKDGIGKLIISHETDDEGKVIIAIGTNVDLKSLGGLH